MMKGPDDTNDTNDTTNDTLIFVSSAQRQSGTPGDFDVVFGNSVLHRDRDSVMRIAVAEASIPRTWYSLREGYNRFVVQPIGHVVTLELAYYNAVDLRVALIHQLPPENGADWQVTYSRLTNKYTIRRPPVASGITQYTWDLTDFPSEALGFSKGETPTFTQFEPRITSTIPVRVNEDNAVLIHTDLPTAGNASVDNLSEGVFGDSTILAKIPIVVAPYDTISYMMESNLFWQVVNAHHVDRVRIFLTDDQGRPLDLQHDWSLVLVVQQQHRKKSTGHLKTIADTLKLMALSDEKVMSS